MDFHYLTILTEKLLNFFFYQFTIKERQKIREENNWKSNLYLFFSLRFFKEKSLFWLKKVFCRTKYDIA